MRVRRCVWTQPLPSWPAVRFNAPLWILVALFRIITTIFAHRITVYPDKNFTTDPPGWEGLDHTALRPQKRDEDRGEEGERVKARPRIPPEKDRRDRGSPTELWKYKAVSPRHCAAASAPRICCFTQKTCLGGVTVSFALLLRNNPAKPEVQLSQPNFTSLLMISSGLTAVEGHWSSTSLLLISPGTLCKWAEGLWWWRWWNDA